MSGRSLADYLDAMPTRGVRSPGLSSDTFSTATKSGAAAAPPAHPPPAYVAPSEAADLVSGELDRFVAVSDGALGLVNGFLDQVLFTILATSHSLSLDALRTAVPMVLKPRLGKAALSAADEELNDYLEESDVDGLNVGHQIRDLRAEFPLEDAWKLARLRCMVYARLGDMEEEDEEAHLEDSDLSHYLQLSREGTDHPALPTPAAAIFLTAILEFLAEQALCLAGQHAEKRQRLGGKNMGIETLTIEENEDTDQILLLETDMFHVGREGPLSRLWRIYRRHTRTAQEGIESRPITPGILGNLSSSSPAHSRKESHTSPIATINEERPVSSVHPAELVVASPAPPEEVPISPNDIVLRTAVPVEVEVPKVAPVLPKRSRKRPVSIHAIPDQILEDTRIAADTGEENSVSGNQKGRSRSQSLPHPVFLPGIGYLGHGGEQISISRKDSGPEAVSEYEQGSEEEDDDVDAAQKLDNRSQLRTSGGFSGAMSGAVAVLAGALGVGAATKTVQYDSKTVPPTDENNSSMQSIYNAVTMPSSAKSATVPDQNNTFHDPSISSHSSRLNTQGKTSSPPETSDPEDLALSSQDEAEHQSQISSGSRGAAAAKAKISLDRDPYNLEQPSPGIHTKTEEEAMQNSVVPTTSRPVSTASKPTGQPSVRHSFASIQTVGSDEPTQPARLSHASAKSGSPNLMMQPISNPGSPSDFSRSATTFKTAESGLTTSPASKHPYVRLRDDTDERSFSRSSEREESETKKKDLDSLINSGETLHYTLTPQSARDDSFNPILSRTKSQTIDPISTPRTSAPDDIAQSSRSPQLVRDTVTGSRAHPPDQSSGSAAGQSRKVIPSSANIVQHESTGPKRRNPLGEPREARAERTTTRDLADYARSTGPADATQLPKALSAPRIMAGGEENSSNLKRPTSRGRFEARDARPTRSTETADLAKFIREGPPAGQSGGRTVSGAYLANELDALPLHDSARASGHSSQASAQESAPNGKSVPSSMNSHTGLLDSSGAMGVSASTTPRVPPAIPEDKSLPKVNRGKGRDPYAIDYSDDESDEEMFHSKAKGNEESLIDFLRNTAPPPGMLTQPIVAAGAIDDHPTIRKAVSSSRLRGSFGGGSGGGEDSDRAVSRLSRDSASVRERSPHLTQTGSKLDKYRPTQTTHAAHIDRNRRSRVEAREAKGNNPSGSTRELAEYLRNTGPPAYTEHRESSALSTNGNMSEGEPNKVAKFFGRKGSLQR